MATITPLRPNPGDVLSLIIRKWLETTARKHEVSYEAWAAKAGTSATNITRFLSRGSPIPKLETLAKLATALAEPLPILDMQSTLHGVVELPIINARVAFARGVRHAMSVASESVRVPAISQARAGVFVTADTFSLGGVLLGDLVLVDLREPVTGDTVAVAHADGTVGCLRVEADGSLRSHQPGPPLVLKAGDARIVGVAVSLQRQIGQAALASVSSLSSSSGT